MRAAPVVESLMLKSVSYQNVNLCQIRNFCIKCLTLGTTLGLQAFLQILPLVFVYRVSGDLASFETGQCRRISFVKPGTSTCARALSFIRCITRMRVQSMRNTESFGRHCFSFYHQIMYAFISFKLQFLNL